MPKHMVFDDLFLASTDSEGLRNSIRNFYPRVTELYEASYTDQLKEKNSIERFILLRNRVLSSFVYDTIDSKSFLLILLDLCERFCLYSSILHVDRILRNNNINITKRMAAGLLMNIPTPSSNQDLIDRFDSISKLLNEAIIEEEDNDTLSIVTFLNYYAHVVINTNLYYINQIKNKVSIAIEEHGYTWLRSIAGLISSEIIDIEQYHQRIEEQIDILLNKRETSKHSQTEQFLVEANTDYSKEIAEVPNKFLEIRLINVKHSTGLLYGRGVNQLTTEDEMYEYIKRYGKMHYAKMMSSLEESFPQSFFQDFDIIDWGCGQALATMSFIEKYGCDNVSSITLIEPSEIVIKRAALHCIKFAPQAKIRTICKTLDAVSASDFLLTSPIRIHLFSNILDIDDYKVGHLIDVVDNLLYKEDYFICVSPYINDIKSAKIQSFMNHFEGIPSFTVYHDKENTKQGEFWSCNNSFGKMTISHGLGYTCGNYDINGCSNKWTRIMKVFSVKDSDIC